MHALFMLVVLAPPPEVAPAPRLIDLDQVAKRSMRWVLRFRIENGKDYVAQLRALGAILGVNVPERMELIMVPDLSTPTKHRIATEDDLKMLAKRIRFSDARIDAVKGVVAEMGLDITPKDFWAFFPHSVEEELARKELSYRNRRSDEIEQTIFRIKMRGGKPEFFVDDQVVKKSR